MEVNELTQVLLVDDNPADLDLMKEVLGHHRRCHITTAQDGEQALLRLRAASQASGHPLPGLVMLDLNLPRKDGRAVLAELKTDPMLKSIAVVVFTTSQARHDIENAYRLGANCYVSKPGNLKDFIAVVKSLEEFWLSSAHLPRRVT
jgi:chemotaxis family two-component system response regulator Rcp1